MLTIRIFFSILSLVIYFIPNSAEIVSGFENDKTCIRFKSKALTKTVVVQKNNSSTVVIWKKHDGKWEALFGTLYNKTIEANSGPGDELEFCFKNTSRQDSGYYNWTDEQDKSKTFELQVWYGPTNLRISEEFRTLDKKQQKIINCSADCYPDCIITWKKGRDEIITDPTAKSLLIINNVSESDRGEYTCLAENPNYKSHFLSEQYRISVQYAAKILPTFQTEYDLKEYSNTNISCRVDSNPLSNISWLKENKEINTTYSADNEVVLLFENISCDDTGVYKCSAFNGIGRNDTKESVLNVSCNPRFVNNYLGNYIEKNVTTFIGDEIKMNISIQANPTPKVLCDDFGIHTEIFKTSNTMFTVAVKKIVLSDFDFKKYTLIIGNSQGNVTIVINISKKRKNSVIFNGFVIGTPLYIGIGLIALILISILVLVLTVIKRRKHSKDNQANSNPSNGDDTGGYRDNILYQSIDSVSFQARDLNFDGFDESIL